MENIVLPKCNLIHTSSIRKPVHNSGDIGRYVLNKDLEYKILISNLAGELVIIASCATQLLLKHKLMTSSNIKFKIKGNIRTKLHFLVEDYFSGGN